MRYYGGSYSPDFVNLEDFVKETTFSFSIYDVIIRINVKVKRYERCRLNTKLTKLYLTELIKIIYTTTQNRYKDVTIVYYQTTNKKRLPVLDGDTLTKNEVNSGLCYVNSGDGDVNIELYREEEFYKVLTHEMLHLYKVIPHDHAFEERFRRRYPLLDYINTNESLVELNALIINSIIIHKIFNIDFETLISQELKWCKEVKKKLYKHFNIASNREVNTKWKESTHAFSYYSIKTDMLVDLMKKYKSRRVVTQQYPKKYIFMTINDARKYKLT